MRTAALCLIMAFYAAPIAAQTPSLYLCQTKNGDFRYIIDTRSKTIRFNDFEIMRYTRDQTRSAADVAEYNVIFDGTVDVSSTSYVAPGHYYISLFKSSDDRVWLQDKFSNALVDRNNSAFSLTDIEEVAGSIPCQSGQR